MSISVSAVASRSARREGVQLHDVRPRREVGVTAVGEDLAGDVEPGRPGRASRSAVAADEPLRVVAHPGVVGRDVVGHEVQEQPGAAPAQLGPGDREAGGTAERVVDDVAADAVRRADDVVRCRSGRAARNEDAAAPGCPGRRARPAGLRSHTPISQTASTPAGATASQASAGTWSSRRTGGARRRQVAQPRPGVDLVDHRLLRPAGHDGPWNGSPGRVVPPVMPLPQSS